MTKANHSILLPHPGARRFLSRIYLARVGQTSLCVLYRMAMARAERLFLRAARRIGKKCAVKHPAQASRQRCVGAHRFWGGMDGKPLRVSLQFKTPQLLWKIIIAKVKNYRGCISRTVIIRGWLNLNECTQQIGFAFRWWNRRTCSLLVPIHYSPC